MSDDTNKTYYLRPGKEHNVVLRGEMASLKTAGAEVELSEITFQAFRDKFFTEAEWNAYKASQAELAAGDLGANPADDRIPSNEGGEEDGEDPGGSEGGEEGEGEGEGESEEDSDSDSESDADTNTNGFLG